MTYYGGKALADSFRTVRKNTIGIAQEIPEARYAYRATPDTRSVAEMLVHIALSYKFQHTVHARRLATLEGFDFMPLVQELGAEEQTPRTKDQIIDLLRTSGETWAGYLEGLPEELLAETVSMPPGITPAVKSRFEMLLSTKEHEMHHRGQLMLIERLIGIIPHLTREMQARMARMRPATASA